MLVSLWGYEGTLTVKSALNLAPMLAVRPGELRSAQWADIDLDQGEWHYLITKTMTEHIVPLSRQAVAVLRELRPATAPVSPYVFPSARSPRRCMSDNAVLAALRRMDIPKDVMTGHGFRASFRTLGDEVLKFRVDLIEHQLGHNVKDALGRAYNRPLPAMESEARAGSPR